MMKKQILKSFLCLVVIFFTANVWNVQAAGLTLSETNQGTIDHTVTVESEGQFRLAFEAAYNYGLSKWYDLVNDQSALLDIAQNPTDYIPDHQQGALFNQVINPGDLIGSIISAKNYQSNVARSLSIIENSSSRVIIEVSYHPMIGNSNNLNLLFIDRYHIYTDGKIYINHKMHSDTNQTVTEWRNSIIGLGDPFFQANGSSGTFIANNSARTLTDATKNWTTNQWAGYMTSYGYDHWAITGNTDNTLQIGAKIGGGGNDVLVNGSWGISSRGDKFGWLRATDTQNPYTWSGSAAKYLFEYWDSTTPAPNTNWTKASIMMTPKAGNPYQGGQSTHEWRGFKRWFYNYGSISLTAGQDVVQQYYMQLGTQNSTILPNIINSTVANPYANDYRNPATLVMTTGTSGGYDATEGVYNIAAAGKQAQFSIDGVTYKRIKPVFKISNYNSIKEPQIVVDGQAKQVGTDFNVSQLDASTILVQMLGDINSNVSISITEGSTDFPPLDHEAPSVPANLSGVAASETQINLSWSASTDNVGVAGYHIYRAGNLLASQAGTTYSDSGLTVGTQYTYTVSAYDNMGNTSAPTQGVNVATRNVAPSVPIEKKNYAILPYTTESQGVLNWIKDRFSFKIGGINPSDSSFVNWMGYFDIYGPGSLSDITSLRDWANNNGYDTENILLHAKTNYTSAINPAWSQMDKFDNFEGAKGVMRTADDITYTDLTSTAYAGSVTWQNTMYIGYEEAFDQINLVFSTPGSGITKIWEFWNGTSWTALSVTDGTNSFVANGQILFVPPADWTRKIINGSRNKYFVRCRITASTTNPVTSSVKGDDWLRGTGNLVRGWNASDAGVINTGELKYNPTPPANALAKFPYQARITYWSSNHAVANPADQQGGNRTWAKFAAYKMVNMINSSGSNGIMSDDGERDVSGDGIAATSTDFVDRTSNSWATESINKYQDIVSFVHALKPDAKVGINAQNKAYVKKGDWNVAEYHTFNWKTGSPVGITYANGDATMTYDDYLPANNPTGIIGVMVYQDTVDMVPVNTPTVEWDRGNRGPIVALSKHYIAANDNTLFSYYTEGGYVYSDTDQVYLKDNSVKHLATDSIPTVDQVKRWATWFPAMGIDIGAPDASGYNGGVRNFNWNGVWRRDYTKAIVLHRSAYWDTVASDYNTYSSPIDLGGTYYPLSADGTVGSGITQLALRAGDGAILMKQPTIISDVIAPASPTGLAVQ